MKEIRLKFFNSHHEAWCLKHIGPRMHYLHNSIGGEGWIAKRKQLDLFVNDKGYSDLKEMGWALTFEDDRYATWFRLTFPND